MFFQQEQRENPFSERKNYEVRAGFGKGKCLIEEGSEFLLPIAEFVCPRWVD